MSAESAQVTGGSGKTDVAGSPGTDPAAELPQPTFSLYGTGGRDHTWLRAELLRRGFNEAAEDAPYASFVWGELTDPTTPSAHYDKRFARQGAELKSILDDAKMAVCDKTQLYLTLGPQPFLPRTRALSDVARVEPGEVLVLKPAAGFRQQDIAFVASAEALARYKAAIPEGIACDYVQDPMLWEGRKFHLRCYLLVYAAAGLARAYLYDRHNVLTAAKPYSGADWDDQDALLSGGKRTPGFLQWPDALAASGVAPDVIATADASIAAAMRVVAQAACGVASTYPESAAAFEVLGADVMVDAQGKAWVLELNNKIGLPPGMADPERSARWFKWVLDSAVLPHFGLALAPPPLWAGASRLPGALAPYVWRIAAAEPLQLCPPEQLTSEQREDLCRLSHVPPRDDGPERPNRSAYCWAILCGQVVEGYALVQPSGIMVVGRPEHTKPAKAMALEMLVAVGATAAALRLSPTDAPAVLRQHGLEEHGRYVRVSVSGPSRPPKGHRRPAAAKNAAPSGRGTPGSAPRRDGSRRGQGRA